MKVWPTSQPRAQVIAGAAVDVNADTLRAGAEAAGAEPLPPEVEDDETPPATTIGLDDETGGTRSLFRGETPHVNDQDSLLTLGPSQPPPALPIEALIPAGVPLPQKRGGAEDGVKALLEHGQDRASFLGAGVAAAVV